MKPTASLLALFASMLLTANAWAVPARTDQSQAKPAASYKVRKGDSLYAISRRVGVTVEELKRLNGLRTDMLKPGQTLVFAASAGSSGKLNTGGKATASTAHPAKVSTYKVKKGDTLYAIARRNDLSVAALKRLNNLRSDALKPGQQLVVARQASTGTAEPALDAGPGAAELLRQATASLPAEEGVLLETSLESLEKVAYSYLATPYRFGGSSHQGIDCSSFVRNVFREFDIELPRTAREQYRLGVNIDPDDLRSGDLLFFRTYAKYPSHVGIYLGEQKMIHASPRSRRVVIASVDAPYFRSRFIGARRLAQFDGRIDLDLLPADVEEAAEGSLEETVDSTPIAAGH